MNYVEFYSKYKFHLDLLSQEKKLGLAVSVCKKLYFDYENFCKAYNFGDANILMDGIIMCDKFTTEKYNNESILKMITEIQSITPDTDDFGDLNGSYALSACTAVIETLEFIIDQNQIHIYNVGCYYLDTLDFKINEENNLRESEKHTSPVLFQAMNFLLRL